MRHGWCGHTKYHLNCSEYEALLRRSQGRCERCSVAIERHHIDHDHALGRWAVRGFTEAASDLRAELKRQFPEDKLSVRRDRGTAAGWVHVRWVDGPVEDAVRSAVAEFSKHFSGVLFYRHYSRLSSGREIRTCGPTATATTRRTLRTPPTTVGVGCSRTPAFSRGTGDRG